MIRLQATTPKANQSAVAARGGWRARGYDRPFVTRNPRKAAFGLALLSSPA